VIEDVSLLMCVVRDLTCILVLGWCVVNDVRFFLFVAQLKVYCTYVNKLFIKII